MRLWLAYPHQNLAAAAERMEDPGAAVKAVARLAGLDELDLPAFGPFALPPADAIAIAAATSPVAAGNTTAAGRTGSAFSVSSTQ